MIAMTTSSSISVKPVRRDDLTCICSDPFFKPAGPPEDPVHARPKRHDPVWRSRSLTGNRILTAFNTFSDARNSLFLSFAPDPGPRRAFAVLLTKTPRPRRRRRSVSAGPSPATGAPVGSRPSRNRFSRLFQGQSARQPRGRTTCPGTALRIVQPALRIQYEPHGRNLQEPIRK